MKEEIAKQVQVYAYNNTQQILQFAQTEKVIYGSSRLGTNFNPIPLFASQNSTQPVLFITHNIGLSTYELTNHLGNVLSVISDKPIPHQNGQTVDYWQAEVRQATDYSPFGVQLQTRNLSLTILGNAPYRFGFQNQEEDAETGLVNYKYRMHDPRIGRFFAIDPLASDYPWNSPYAFSENKLIAWGELEGLECYFSASGKYLGLIGDKDDRDIRIVQAKDVEEVKTLIQDAKGLKETAYCFQHDKKEAINKSYLWSDGTMTEKGNVSETIFKIWVDYSIEEFSIYGKSNPNYVGATFDRNTFYVSDYGSGGEFNNNLFNQICLWTHEKTHAENMISANSVCDLGYSFHHFDCIRAETTVWSWNYATKDYKENTKLNALDFLSAELIDIENQTDEAVKARMTKQYNSDLKYFIEKFNISNEEMKTLSGDGAKDSGKTLKEGE